MSEGSKATEEFAPYQREFLRKITGRTDNRQVIDWIRELPFEKRYISRVVSALKIAFIDFDSVCLRIDANTLPSDQVKRIIDELEIRQSQLDKALQELRAFVR